MDKWQLYWRGFRSKWQCIYMYDAIMMYLVCVAIEIRPTHAHTTTDDCISIIIEHYIYIGLNCNFTIFLWNRHMEKPLTKRPSSAVQLISYAHNFHSILLSSSLHIAYSYPSLYIYSLVLCICFDWFINNRWCGSITCFVCVSLNGLILLLAKRILHNFAFAAICQLLTINGYCDVWM